MIDAHRCLSSFSNYLITSNHRFVTAIKFFCLQRAKNPLSSLQNSQFDLLILSSIPICSPGSPNILPKMSAALDLSELPTAALVKEMERRLECLNKPEKRIVLIGE